MAQSSVLNGPGQGVHEGFFISALKRQNREMRTELDEKNATIEKLRKDIKLTKTFELE